MLCMGRRESLPCVKGGAPKGRRDCDITRVVDVRARSQSPSLRYRAASPLYTRGPLGPRVGAIRQRAKTQSISFNNSSAVVPNSAAKAIKFDVLGSDFPLSHVETACRLTPKDSATKSCVILHAARWLRHQLSRNFALAYAQKHQKPPAVTGKGPFCVYSRYSSVYFSFRYLVK